MSKPKKKCEIDFWRQLDIFSPTKFNKSITVIGAGAAGSYIVWLLAKMGCRDITVYDFDKVENHNLPNQTYGLEDVGKKKVIALAKRTESETGVKIKTHAKRFIKESVKGIVFVVTDTMESRKEIWENSVRNQLNVDLLLETRMAAEGGKVYVIRPTMPKHITAYEKTLHPDSEAEESPCTQRAIAPTVATIAGVAVFSMINFVNSKSFANEVIISLSPPIILSKNF